jgi:uncharacterized protein (TIGR00251 family)
MADWLRETADGSLLLSLHIQPGAKQTGFAGLHGEAMKLRLAAPPVEGRANAALCAFLADFCGVPKSAVTLVSGETSRAKRVRVEHATPAAMARLRALAG